MGRNYEPIVHELSQELGIPLSEVDNAIKDLWEGVRFYITNPEYSKGGILLEKFGKFRIEEATLMGRYKKYNYLLDQLKKYESRQKKQG